MTTGTKRWLMAAWMGLIVGFAAAHAWNLRADFPNGSPWIADWAKYTDEGWYGNAAIRAHLFGNWYLAGDFNPAVAVPVWPFVEWALFFVTGVTPEAARGLAVAAFFVNLELSYLLLRRSGPRWMALLGLTPLVTSPFLYCFSRLAILEPLQTTFCLAGLNVAVRLGGMKRPVWAAAGVGALFTLIMLTKTTAVFLLPALGWAIAASVWPRRRVAAQCLAAAGATSGAAYGLWMAAIAQSGLWPDFKYYFAVNNYPRPPELYWPAVSFWWSLHGTMWIDRMLVPLAGLIFVAALARGRSEWARGLWREPVFGASVLGVAGMVLFMAYQNHPQPRYFSIAAVFCFLIVALGVRALLKAGSGFLRTAGWAALAAVSLAVIANGVRTAGYAMHPEYTYVRAADALVRYIDAHPNGNRLLLSISGDQISLFTHLPAICDDFGTIDLPRKIGVYRPGWYAAWNDLDPGTLEDLHTHDSIEQVAEFPALDHPERNLLVLFKLRPLPGGRLRDPEEEDMKGPLPDDSFDVPIE